MTMLNSTYGGASYRTALRGLALTGVIAGQVLAACAGGTVPAGVQTPGRSSSEATQWMNDDVLRALRGEPPVHIFNRDVLNVWKQRFGGKSVL